MNRAGRACVMAVMGTTVTIGNSNIWKGLTNGQRRRCRKVVVIQLGRERRGYRMHRWTVIGGNLVVLCMRRGRCIDYDRRVSNSVDLTMGGFRVSTECTVLT